MEKKGGTSNSDIKNKIHNMENNIWAGNTET